jgi:RNase P/RNase MRP subunit p30
MSEREVGREGGDPTWREEAVASKPRYAVTCPASIFLSSSPMSVHEWINPRSIITLMKLDLGCGTGTRQVRQGQGLAD